VLEKLKALVAWYKALPNKSIMVAVPLKLSVLVGAAIVFLAFGLIAADVFKSRVVGYEPVTLADFSKLEQKVSACVPAPKSKAKKR